MKFPSKKIIPAAVLGAVLLGAAGVASALTCPSQDEAAMLKQGSNYNGLTVQGVYPSGTLGQFYQSKLTGNYLGNLWECNYYGPYLIQFMAGNVKPLGSSWAAGPGGQFACTSNNNPAACPVDN